MSESPGPRWPVTQAPVVQVIFTTHSPYIVDELEPQEVIVLALDEAGHTVARSLADHPDAQRALSVLTTGEFLAAEGEEWVFAKAGEKPS